MIEITSKGSFAKTDRFLRAMTSGRIFRSLGRYGAIGCSALSSATPIDSGLASQSWTSDVRQNGSGWEINWYNIDVEGGFHVAIALQYGHGTGSGGWVAGRDYINPAIRPVFDKIAEAVWREVTNL